jgi:hypothetical protein
VEGRQTLSSRSQLGECVCQPRRWQMNVEEFTKKRQIGFRHDLPFAPPVLRRSELYTLTFHPGARLARQTVGGGLRVIAGISHPKWVNRASASVRVRRSGRVSGGWTIVGADRALLFVLCRPVRAVFANPSPGPAPIDQSLQVSLMTPSSSSPKCSCHTSFQTSPIPTCGRGPRRECSWQDNQRVQ